MTNSPKQVSRPRYGSTDTQAVPVQHPDGHYQEYESQSYTEAQARMRMANLHAAGPGAEDDSSPGILKGLSVSGGLGSAAISVQPGVAIDGQRRVVALSQGKSIPLDPTGNAGKRLYVTIRYAETDNESPTDTTSFPRPSTFDFGTIDSTPVIEIADAAAGFNDDGSSVVLAVVTLRSDGTGLESLMSVDANVQRRVAGQTMGELRITRTHQVNQQITESPAGMVAATESGDLRVISEFGRILLEANSVVQGDLECSGTIQGTLADNMVDSQQLADGSVTTAELADGSVTAAKIVNGGVTAAALANGSVTSAKIVAGSVTSNELANGAVTTDKLVNGAITAAKIAAGVLPREIGVVVASGLQNNQFIPVPSGFSRSECIFYAAIKLLNINPSGNSELRSCTVDAQGKINSSPPGLVIAMGLALAKKGGWNN